MVTLIYVWCVFSPTVCFEHSPSCLCYQLVFHCDPFCLSYISISRDLFVVPFSRCSLFIRLSFFAVAKPSTVFQLVRNKRHSIDALSIQSAFKHLSKTLSPTTPLRLFFIVPPSLFSSLYYKRPFTSEGANINTNHTDYPACANRIEQWAIEVPYEPVCREQQVQTRSAAAREKRSKEAEEKRPNRECTLRGRTM